MKILNAERTPHIIYKVVSIAPNGRFYSCCPCHNATLEYSIGKIIVRIPGTLGLYVFRLKGLAHDYASFVTGDLRICAARVLECASFAKPSPQRYVIPRESSLTKLSHKTMRSLRRDRRWCQDFIPSFADFYDIYHTFAPEGTYVVPYLIPLRACKPAYHMHDVEYF